MTRKSCKAPFPLSLIHISRRGQEKYNLISSRIHCPARIAPAQEDAIRQAACTVYRALGCRVCARVDFFLTPAGEIVFNEVNTLSLIHILAIAKEIVELHGGAIRAESRDNTVSFVVTLPTERKS